MCLMVFEDAYLITWKPSSTRSEAPLSKTAVPGSSSLFSTSSTSLPLLLLFWLSAEKEVGKPCWLPPWGPEGWLSLLPIVPFFLEISLGRVLRELLKSWMRPRARTHKQSCWLAYSKKTNEWLAMTLSGG